MDRPAEELHENGVALRRWRVTDATDLHLAVSESIDHLAPWMPWATADYSERDTLDYLLRTVRDWETGEAFNYRIATADDRTIGSCGLMARIGLGGLEVGYWLRREYTGRGIATVAARLLTAEALRIGAERVEIVHDARNVRSGAIPVRLGFTEVERVRQGEESDTRVEVRWRLTSVGH